MSLARTNPPGVPLCLVPVEESYSRLSGTVLLVFLFACLWFTITRSQMIVNSKHDLPNAISTCRKELESKQVEYLQVVKVAQNTHGQFPLSLPN